MTRVSFVLFLSILLCSLAQPGWTTAKVYLTNGETRVGFVHVLDGRVTIRGEDRLYQYAQRAVHRIEHVTGDTALAGKDDLFLREKPEKLSRNLIFVPKGCEVIVRSTTGDWAMVEVYGGKRFTQGYVLATELSDAVYLNPPLLPNIKFKDPPPSLKDKYPDRKKPRPKKLSPEMLTPFFEGAEETDFGMLSQRLYGTTPEGVMEQKKAVEDQKGTSAQKDEDLLPRPVEPTRQ